MTGSKDDEVETQLSPKRKAGNNIREKTTPIRWSHSLGVLVRTRGLTPARTVKGFAALARFLLPPQLEPVTPMWSPHVAEEEVIRARIRILYLSFPFPLSVLPLLYQHHRLLPRAKAREQQGNSKGTAKETRQLAAYDRSRHFLLLFI